jgi:hypothetical protein
MSSLRLWRGATLASVGALVVVAAHAAVAGSSNLPRGSIRGGQVVEVDAVSGSVGQSTQSDEFVDLPGATLTVDLPIREGLFVMRFSGESTCTTLSGVQNRGACTVRILVTKGASPVIEEEFILDTATGSIPTPNARGLERFTGAVGPGTYTLRVQFKAVQNIFGEFPLFTLDDWVFILETVSPG